MKYISYGGSKTEWERDEIIRSIVKSSEQCIVVPSRLLRGVRKSPGRRTKQCRTFSSDEKEKFL